jgi:hypothetical protein
MFNDLRLGKPDYLDKMVILRKRRPRLILPVGLERKGSCEAVAAASKNDSVFLLLAGRSAAGEDVCSETAHSSGIDDLFRKILRQFFVRRLQIKCDRSCMSAPAVSSAEF